ncbi:MAG: Sec-independent protein translocase protein TatB [Paracoccaceae bacterium]
MDLSWSELLVVAIVALIIIGPKDLPGMFRELGRFTAKIRAMGREFSRAMEQAAKESGVKDVADDLRSVTSAKSMGLDTVKSAADKFEKWDPLKNAAKPTKPLTPAPMPATPAAATTAAPVAAPAVEAAPAAAGPATAALYEKKAARKAVLDEASTKLRAISDPTPASPAPAPAAKAPGRRRKKAEPGSGDAA